MRIDFHDIPIDLLSEKAVFLPSSECLIISDVHIGKTLDLQREGVRVPAIAATQNEKRISNLLTVHSPKTCYFLGDLFHYRHNSEFDSIKRIVRKHPSTKFVLIKGNHEILKDTTYEDLGLHLADEDRIDGIVLRHHPMMDSEAPSLSGHIHPKVRLSGRGRESMARPVFAIHGACMVLPAFGALTGGHKINPKEYSEVYVVASDEVIRMK
ncbi:MAG: ligase-associated DNA damage response endonuclease PdeM [Flavobacteriales bacterium]|nr:ligase-associated DNA damage response endonuclease PdeM [Flavobacteriales bacterium]